MGLITTSHICLGRRPHCILLLPLRLSHVMLGAVGALRAILVQCTICAGSAGGALVAATWQLRCDLDRAQQHPCEERDAPAGNDDNATKAHKVPWRPAGKAVLNPQASDGEQLRTRAHKSRRHIADVSAAVAWQTCAAHIICPAASLHTTHTGAAALTTVPISPRKQLLHPAVTFLYPIN